MFRQGRKQTWVKEGIKVNVENQQTLGRIVLLGGNNLESEEQSENCAEQNTKNHPTASILLTRRAGILTSESGSTAVPVCRHLAGQRSLEPN